MTFSPSSHRSRASNWLSLRKLFIIVFVAVLAAYSAYQSRIHYEQQARVSADNLAQLLGNHISSAIEKIDLVLKIVVRDVLQHQARGGIDRHDLELLLAQQQLLLPDAKDLLIADAEGVFRYGVEVPPGFRIDISGLDYFKRLRDEPGAGLVISGPYQSPVDKQWVMVFARRMTRPDGSFAGIVSAAISAEHFRDMLRPLNLGRHGAATLRTADMRAVAHFPPVPNTEVAGSQAVPPPFLASLASSPDAGIFVAPGPFDRIDRASAYRKLPGLPLYTVVGLATDDYLASWWSEVFELAGMVVVFSLVTLRLSYLARRAAQRQRDISRLLREAVEHAAVGFAIFDPQDRLAYCNEDSRDFFPEYRGVPTRGGKFEDLLRAGVTRGGFPIVLENPERWLRERMRLHEAADGTPAVLKLRDGRQLLSIEHRTASGHTIANRIDITELAQYRQHLEGLVEKRTAELKAALDQFRILVEHSPTAIAMFDRELNYLATSRRWLDTHGEGRETLVGQPLHGGHGDFPGYWKGVHHAALAGISDRRDEDLWVRADGSRRWLRWAVHPWVDPSGRIGGIIISTEDITERKLAEERLLDERQARQAILEQQVAERTAELRAANRQLEGFLYAASHDLKGPLGRISSFSTLLERKFRDRLEGEGLQFLGFIRDNALRLNLLIDDLMSHARVDQQDTDLQPIDLAAAVRAALEARADEIRESGAAVRLALPAVRVLADPYALDQVLLNLLDNALKYSAEAPAPTLDIGGEAAAGHVRLWMRDNGIGFDMAYHDRIFEIFRRLHTHAEYAGTGVGLALVKRAMERMGGKVWAESASGQGATFYLQFEQAAPG